MAKKQKKLTLSLIIPVYNEERHISRCLDHIARQTIAPFEVIVVDNNCSDKTADLARKFPFVRVIKQPLQGRGHARNKGFNSARGDILGRIDADSLLEPEWVEKVIRYFESDAGLDGIAGMGVTPLIPYLRWPRGTFHMRAYFYNVHAYFRTVIMWGGNMAIRSSAWQRVKKKVCLDDFQVHEDQDLTLWMVGSGSKIRKAYDVRVTANDQSYRYLPKTLHYIAIRNRTARLHSEWGNMTSKNIGLSTWDVVGSRLLTVPAILYSLTASIITLPIDIFALKILEIDFDKWFN